MLRSLVLVACVVLAGCLPEEHELEGRRCDEAHRCPLDLQCVEGFCRAHARLGVAGGGVLSVSSLP